MFIYKYELIKFTIKFSDSNIYALNNIQLFKLQ